MGCAGGGCSKFCCLAAVEFSWEVKNSFTNLIWWLDLAHMMVFGISLSLSGEQGLAWNTWPARSTWKQGREDYPIQKLDNISTSCVRLHYSNTCVCDYLLQHIVEC